MPFSVELENEYYDLLDKHNYAPKWYKPYKMHKNIVGDLLNDMPEDYLENLSTYDEDLYSVAQLIESVEKLKKYKKNIMVGIEQGISLLCIDFPYNVYVNDFPTGHYNAVAKPAKYGVLILVNSGLNDVLSGGFRLFTNFFLKSDSEDLSNNEHIDLLNSIIEEDGNLIIREVANQVLKYVCSFEATKYSYFMDPKFDDEVLNATSPFSSSTGINYKSDALIENSMKFVIGHEYGHILSGHLNANNTCFSRTPVGEIEVFSTNDENIEYEADLIGAKIVVASSLNPIGDRAIPFLPPIVISGINAFLLFDGIFKKAATDIYGLSEEDLVGDTHPSAFDRMLELNSKIKNIYSEIFCQLEKKDFACDQHTSPFENRKGLIQYIKEIYSETIFKYNRHFDTFFSALLREVIRIIRNYKIR